MRYLLFLMCMMAFTQRVTAQSSAAGDSMEVAFSVVIPKEVSLNAAERNEMRQKLEVMLARTQTFAPEGKSPFVIVPEVKVTSKETTAGAKETFTLVEGELVLLVKNRYNGTAYNELSMELRQLVKTQEAIDAKMLLIKGINPKDKRFVRFVRTTQNRIAEYFEGNAVDVP